LRGKLEMNGLIFHSKLIIVCEKLHCFYKKFLKNVDSAKYTFIILEKIELNGEFKTL